MTDERTCPQCGRVIPPDAPGGVCPVCLMMAAAESPEFSRPGAVRDTNLLFALFAHMLRYISTEQFMEAIEAWAENPSVPVADYLVDQEIVSKASRQYLEGLIAHGLEFYEGNVTKTLDSLGGHKRVASIIKSAATTSAHDLMRTRLTLQLPEEFLEETPSEEMAVRERPGRYTGSSEYSRGGMGRILLVHDELLARDIALKELLPPSDIYEGAQGPEPSPIKQSAALLARFLREARVTGRLEHPSIVPVYELGRRDDGTLYYTMRLVRGKTLRTVLQECKSLDDRLKLLPNFVDLCMGIAYAHSRGIVHRDIKPSNVMIGEFGETVIIDWGLAKVVGQQDEEHPSLEDTLHRLHGDHVPGPDKTVTGEVLGSPHYMSPEQAAGRVVEIDARSDVFSLGTVLYEILADHAAFDKSSIEGLIEQIQHEEPVPIEKREPRVPRELASICYRALHKEKGKRYASAKDMADDINRFLTGSLVAAYTYSPMERLRYVYRKNRVPLNALAVSLLAIVATVAVAFWRIDRSLDDAIAAKERESIALENEVQARTAETEARGAAEESAYRLSIRLASELINIRNANGAQDALWAAAPHMRNWEWGHLLHQAYDEAYTITPDAGIAIQPGGHLLGTYRREPRIAIRDVRNGEVLYEIPTPPRDYADKVEITASGTRMAAVFSSGRVLLWDLTTRQQIAARGPSPQYTGITFSGDGNLLIVSRDDGNVEAWSAGDGSVAYILNGTVSPANQPLLSPDEAYIFARVGLAEQSQVQVWNSTTREPVLLTPGLWPSMSEDNVLAVVAQGRLKLWNVETGKDVSVAFSYPTSRVSPSFVTAAFLAGSHRIVTRSDAGTIDIWDGQTGNLFHTITYQAIDVMPSPDGTRLITWGSDDRHSVWDVASGAKVREVPGLQTGTFRARFSGDGNLLLATTDSRITAWDIAHPAGRLARHESSGIIAGLAISSDERRLAYVNRDRVLRFFDLAGVEVNFGAVVQSPEEYPLAFGSSADEIIFTPDPFTPMVLDVPTGAVRSLLRGHSGRVTAIDSLTSLDQVATGSWDTRVRLWRRSTGELVRVLEGHKDTVTVVRFRSDGSRLLTADYLGDVRLWDAETGEILAETDLGVQVTTGIWSPAGDTVVVGDAKGGIHMLDGGSLSPVRSFPNTAARIEALAFLDGSRLVSADTISLSVWDTKEASQLLSISGSTAGISDVFVLGASGTASAVPRLLTRGEDRTIRTWSPHPWSEQVQKATFTRPRLDEAPVSASPFPSRITLVTTPAFLRQSMENMAAAFGASQQTRGDTGVEVTAGAAERAVGPLGLLPGDLITAIGRNEVREPAECVQAANAVLEQLDASPAGIPLELRMVRRGEPSLFQVALQPVLQREETVQVSVAEAQEILGTALTAIAARRSTTIETSRLQALKQGIDPGPGDALVGLQLAEDALPDRIRFRRLSMSSLDRIMNVNGAAINTIEVYENAIRNALTQAEAGTPAQLTMDIERGNFQRVKLNIEIR